MIREAQRHGRELTPEEAAEFEASRRNGRIGKGSDTTESLIRRGKRVFRTMGKAGADLAFPPEMYDIARQERDFLTLVATLRRQVPTEQAVRTRQARSNQRIERILQLLEQHAHLGRGAAAVVAAKMKVTASYVRRVRAAKRT